MVRTDVLGSPPKYVALLQDKRIYTYFREVFELYIKGFLNWIGGSLCWRIIWCVKRIQENKRHCELYFTHHSCYIAWLSSS
jgi:hypothetical protein